MQAAIANSFVFAVLALAVGVLAVFTGHRPTVVVLAVAMVAVIMRAMVGLLGLVVATVVTAMVVLVVIAMVVLVVGAVVVLRPILILLVAPETDHQSDVGGKGLHRLGPVDLDKEGNASPRRQAESIVHSVGDARHSTQPNATRVDHLTPFFLVRKAHPLHRGARFKRQIRQRQNTK